MKFDLSKTVEAYKRNLGNVSKTCDEVNISRQTFYRVKNENKDFEEALNDGYESVLDMAESKLHEHIKNGNITALIFFLKTKGRKRGYHEKGELEEGDQTIYIGFGEDNDSED